MLKNLKENILLAILITTILVSRKFTDMYILPKQFYALISISVFLVIFLIWLLVRNKKELIIRFNIVDKLYLLFTVYVTVQYFLIKGFSNIEQELILFLSYFIFYFIIRQALVFEKYPLNLHYLLSMTLIFPLIQASYGLMEYFGLVSNSLEFFDIGGSYGNPGAYTNFLIASYPLAFGLIMLNKRNGIVFWQWIIALSTFILVTLILPFTHARTAWIGAFMGVVLVIFYKYRFFQRIYAYKYRWAVMIAVFAVLSFSVFWLYQYKKDSSLGRLFIWELTLKSISENPLFGKGFNTFQHSHNIQQASYFKVHSDDIEAGHLADNILFPYNDYLNIGAETGLLGLFLFLMIVGVIIFRFVKERNNSIKDKCILVPVFFSFLVILLSSLFSYPLESISVNLYFHMFLAILSAGFLNKRTIIIATGNNYKALVLILLIIVGILLRLEVKRYQANLEWGKASSYIQKRNYQKALPIYDKIYPNLRYNCNFLYNYGSELSLLGKYDESIEILKECEQKLNDADVYLYLGNSYEGMGMFNEAEESFKQSSYIIPHKLYPNYRLMYIYAKTNRLDKALEIANKLLSMKPKVDSDISKKIKEDTRQFIRKLK